MPGDEYLYSDKTLPKPCLISNGEYVDDKFGDKVPSEYLILEMQYNGTYILGRCLCSLSPFLQ